MEDLAEAKCGALVVGLGSQDAAEWFLGGVAALHVQ
mgnify:CR=1 FL=1